MRIIRQFTVIIPEPQDRMNDEDSRQFLTGFFYSILSLNEKPEEGIAPLKIIVMFLDCNDEIKKANDESLEKTLSYFIDGGALLRTELDIFDMIERVALNELDAPPIAYLSANYIKNLDQTKKRSEDKIYHQVSQLLEGLTQLHGTSFFPEKIIIQVPYKLKTRIKFIVRNSISLGSIAFIDLFSDCNNAFKFSLGYTDIAIIKEKIQNNQGCYSHILKDELCKRHAEIDKNPIIYISNALPSRKIDPYQSSRFIEYNYSPKILHIEKNGTDDDHVLYKKIIEESFFRRKIFISYGSEEKTNLFRDEVEKYLHMYLPFLDVEIDKRTQRDGSSLPRYISRLKKGEIIIALINEEYFYSRWAMDEILGAMGESRYLPEKIIVILMPSAKPFFELNNATLERCTSGK